MNGIAKIDSSGGLAAFAYPDDHPVVALWVQPESGFLHRLKQLMLTRSAHPARTLVLLPYAQLRPLASRLWARTFGDGFAPRFETAMNWCNTNGGFIHGPTDIRMDAGWDLLTAQNLLVQTGLAEQQSALAALLVQAAHQLSPLAAACAPSERQQWAEQARQATAIGMAGPAMQWEALVSRVAVEWAAQSAYASDLLFEPQACEGIDLLVIVQGISVDPLTAGLVHAWGAQQGVMLLDASLAEPAAVSSSHMALHSCSDAEDEAQRCAAQALAHIARGTFPVP
jgi:ATP-dependent helicase/nuclease subunit B